MNERKIDRKTFFLNSDGTAKGGEPGDKDADYTITTGTLRFKHQETSKIIIIPINKENKVTCNAHLPLLNLVDCYTCQENILTFVSKIS